MNRTPTMYDSQAGFAGITLSVDPINRPRTEGSDNVMAIFQEEQPVTWEFAKPYVADALVNATGEIGFADVGTGSGVFSILVSKHFPGTRVVAIDKSPRAIQEAAANAERNGVSFELRHGHYGPDMLPERSVRVIGLYPPYHLYPEEVAADIPQHARGGSDGQEEFRNQLAVASHHLAEGGIIFFNQMCLGDEGGPEFLEYIPELVPGTSTLYTNVFPAIRTQDFLLGVYGDRHPEYVRETAERSPLVYYAVGIIRRDGKAERREVRHEIDLHGRTWDDRILLHKEIAGHEGA